LNVFSENNLGRRFPGYSEITLIMTSEKYNLINLHQTEGLG